MNQESMRSSVRMSKTKPPTNAAIAIFCSFLA